MNTVQYSTVQHKYKIPSDCLSSFLSLSCSLSHVPPVPLLHLFLCSSCSSVTPFCLPIFFLVSCFPDLLLCSSWTPVPPVSLLLFFARHGRVCLLFPCFSFFSINPLLLFLLLPASLVSMFILDNPALPFSIPLLLLSSSSPVPLLLLFSSVPALLHFAYSFGFVPCHARTHAVFLFLCLLLLSLPFDFRLQFTCSHQTSHNPGEIYFVLYCSFNLFIFVFNKRSRQYRSKKHFKIKYS